MTSFDIQTLLTHIFQMIHADGVIYNIHNIEGSLNLCNRVELQVRDIRDCKQVDADSDDAVMDKRDNELAAEEEEPDNPWY